MFIKIVISLVFVMLSMALYGGENCRTPLATKDELFDACKNASYAYLFSVDPRTPSEWSVLNYPEKDEAWVTGGQWGKDTDVIAIKCTLSKSRKTAHVRMDFTYTKKDRVNRTTELLCLDNYAQFSINSKKTAKHKSDCGDLQRNEKYIKNLLRSGYKANEGEYYNKSLKSLTNLISELCE